jgi:drug/metabolite transporter (DMT)-like permease
MRLFLLCALTMVAFAANSVLNRLALVSQDMDALTFGAIRLAAGALMLALLVALQRRGFAIGGRGRAVGVATLLLYVFGFSLAYRALDAGLGALVLFGVVQITMFAGAVVARDAVPFTRWAGAALAFGGLVWLLWPGGALAQPLLPVLAMALAGVGWGLYSLAGRAAADPLQATAMNFVLAVPFGLTLVLLQGDPGPLSLSGVALAVTSGALTSGLGYALWYAILPRLGASRAAVAQLTVPVLAMTGGLVLLAEPVSLRIVLASLLVLGGVLLSALPLRRTVR